GKSSASDHDTHVRIAPMRASSASSCCLTSGVVFRADIGEPFGEVRADQGGSGVARPSGAALRFLNFWMACLRTSPRPGARIRDTRAAIGTRDRLLEFPRES